MVRQDGQGSPESPQRGNASEDTPLPFPAPSGAGHPWSLCLRPPPPGRWAGPRRGGALALTADGRRDSWLPRIRPLSQPLLGLGGAGCAPVGKGMGSCQGAAPLMFPALHLGGHLPAPERGTERGQHPGQRRGRRTGTIPANAAVGSEIGDLVWAHGHLAVVSSVVIITIT